MRLNIGQITLNNQPTPIFTRHITEISISSLSMLFTGCWQCSLNFTQDSISLAFQVGCSFLPRNSAQIHIDMDNHTNNKAWNHLPTRSCKGTVVYAFIDVLYSSIRHTTVGSGVNFLLCDGPSMLGGWYTDPERVSYDITCWTLCVAFHPWLISKDGNI